MSFVNFSNHPSELWGEKQRQEALKWGEIVDVPFPDIDPNASKKAIAILAERCVEEIMEYDPEAVMCQGEFSLAYTVVQLLKEQGVVVVTACSQRVVTEQRISESETQKNSVFEFVKFREY